MSIAEMFIDDPVGMAALHGLPLGTFMPGFEDLFDGYDFEEEDDSRVDLDALRRCLGHGQVAGESLDDAALPPSATHPTLILDDGDTRALATPAFVGKRDCIGAAQDSQEVQTWWAPRGYVRADLGAHSRSGLSVKLLQSKHFPVVILAGNTYKEVETCAYEEQLVPLLARYVAAGGTLVVQDGQRWRGKLRAAFPGIAWKCGGGARGFGAHPGNEAAVKRLFPELAALRPKRGTDPKQLFYVKGQLLRNVPDGEALFSAAEKGYEPKDNVIVAVARVGAGQVAYFGTYNSCDCAAQIRSFLGHSDIPLDKESFRTRCARNNFCQGPEFALDASDRDALERLVHGRGDRRGADRSDSESGGSDGEEEDDEGRDAELDAEGPEAAADAEDAEEARQGAGEEELEERQKEEEANSPAAKRQRADE